MLEHRKDWVHIAAANGDMSLWRRDPADATAFLSALLTTAGREVELRNNSLAHMESATARL